MNCKRVLTDETFDKFKKKETLTAEQTMLVSGFRCMPYPVYCDNKPYIVVNYSHGDSELVFAKKGGSTSQNIFWYYMRAFLPAAGFYLAPGWKFSNTSKYCE